MANVKVPHGYNPSNPLEDKEFMFKWARVDFAKSPVEWVEDDWDYVKSLKNGCAIYRKLRKQYSFPIYQPIKIISSLDELNSTKSSIEEILPSSCSCDSSSISSPICVAHSKKFQKHIVLNKWNESKPINPNNSFYDHVFKK